MIETLRLKPRGPTRAEIALDRWERHTEFVRRRRQRAIAQAPDAGERKRRTERAELYDKQVTWEISCRRERIEARERHRLELEAKQRFEVERKRRRSMPNFPMR
jgi:hypothetical protein